MNSQVHEVDVVIILKHLNTKTRRKIKIYTISLRNDYGAWQNQQINVSLKLELYLLYTCHDRRLINLQFEECFDLNINFKQDSRFGIQYLFENDEWSFCLFDSPFVFLP